MERERGEWSQVRERGAGWKDRWQHLLSLFFYSSATAGSPAGSGDPFFSSLLQRRRRAYPAAAGGSGGSGRETDGGGSYRQRTRREWIPTAASGWAAGAGCAGLLPLLLVTLSGVAGDAGAGHPGVRLPRPHQTAKPAGRLPPSSLPGSTRWRRPSRGHRVAARVAVCGLGGGGSGRPRRRSRPIPAKPVGLPASAPATTDNSGSANRTGQAVGSLLRRLGLPFHGDESYGKIRINGLSIKWWFKPKIINPSFGWKPTNLTSSQAQLAKGITEQQRSIRSNYNLSLE